MADTRWDHALEVTSGWTGLAGHAGAVLLRRAADRAGLTAVLSAALRKAGTSPVLGRGIVLVSMATAIALGAASRSDIAVLAHPAPVPGNAPSGPAVRRALDLAGGTAMLDRIARARARARARVRTLIEGTPAGFPWLAMLLRPGNAGPDTFTGHRDVLAAAIGQVPARFRNEILVRVDGAGASHELVRHLPGMSSARRKVLFTCGWMITAAGEDAIRQVPAAAWKPGIGQDGAVEEDKHVAEITHLMSRAGNWPGGLRWIARRARPSAGRCRT